MIKAVIFDLFGVLVGHGFDETYRQAGGNPDKDHDFIEAILDQANRGNISDQEFKKGITKRIGISIDQYEQAEEQSEQPNFELLKYAKDLRETYKTAILSNVSGGVVEQKIDQKLLDECFDALIVSAEVGYLKPQPEIYEYTAKKLDVNPNECVFIDDREGYVAAAQKLGMKGIVYGNFAQMKRELEVFLADSN